MMTEIDHQMKSQTENIYSGFTK